MSFTINRGLLYTTLSAVCIIIGTAAAIQYANGSWRLQQTGVIGESGLLQTNSFPTGAEVLIDGKLVTATDDTVYLKPGQYTVNISKDGYIPWEKKANIKSRLITQTNARLFPIAPSLTTLTLTGIKNPAPSPDGQKIVYYVSEASTERRRGLYVLELNNSLLSLQTGPRQILEETSSVDLSKATYIWSPDSSELLLTTPQKEVLLDAGTKNDFDTLRDISFTKSDTLSVWEQDMKLRETEFLSKFPPEILEIATQSATNVYLSPDKKRLLYTATDSAALADSLVATALPTVNEQPQQRTLIPGTAYVYDREEDTNFAIGDVGSLAPAATISAEPKILLSYQPTESTQSAFTALQASDSAKTAGKFLTYHTSLFANTYQWFPDSKHLLFTDGEAISIVSYDGTNSAAIYTGPFRDRFVYPWPDGSKVVVITSFSTGSPDNLYAINLE